MRSVWWATCQSGRTPCLSACAAPLFRVFHGCVVGRLAVMPKMVIKAFDVRGAGAAAPARALSGGNMQKLILGRALLHPDNTPGHTITPKLIVAHQPTWGLDIGAVAYVQSQLIAARDAGAAVLLISDDLDEVLTLGYRVAVMHAGKLSDARPALQWSREAIGLAMAGIQEQATSQDAQGCVA